MFCKIVKLIFLNFLVLFSELLSKKNGGGIGGGTGGGGGGGEEESLVGEEEREGEEPRTSLQQQLSQIKAPKVNKDKEKEVCEMVHELFSANGEIPENNETCETSKGTVLYYTLSLGSCVQYILEALHISCMKRSYTSNNGWRKTSWITQPKVYI